MRVVGLKVDAGLRRRAARVGENAILDEEVFRADDADALAVVIVANDIADDNILAPGQVFRAADIDAVAAGRLNAQALDEHISRAVHADAQRHRFLVGFP